MSKTERREVYTTREVRTLSPQTRTLSNQNLSEFDNNLDHLLEDLQSTVSRPGSSLGNANAYRETTRTSYAGKGDSHTRVQHLTAANPTTIVTDDPAYNFKPGETLKSVKIIKEDYGTINMRATSPEHTRMKSNINKLDSLLDDLQHARQDAGVNPGLLESANSRNVKKTVQRELVYDSDSSSRNRRAGSVEREIVFNDGTYGDLRRQQPSPNRSGTMQSSKSYNYSTERVNTLTPKRTEVVETINPEINPNVLAQLDPTLLPPANTKVTTTIKTYTYEIPGTGYPSAVSPKLSETVYSSNPSTPSQSFAYNKIENSSTSNVTNYPAGGLGGYIRPVSPNPSGYSKQIETTTTRNVNSDGRPILGFESPSLTRKTYSHEENNTSRQITDYPYQRSPRSPKPKEKQVHIYNETTTTNNINHPGGQNGYPSNRYPEGSPATRHHTYIHETNTTNVSRNNGYPPYQDGGYPSRPNGDTTIIYKQDSTTNNNYEGPRHPYTETFDPKNVPPYGNKPPGDNVNVVYKYSTTHTSSNNYRGHPNEDSEPLLHPRPFPTGPGDRIDGPPKKLDQLMAEIGREPPNNAYNAGYTAKQAEMQHKKEVDKLTEASQKKVDVKDLPKSKNIAGPPVYYPPGHEMFSHKEEAGGYRAEGGMMKESGKYKYEESSKSKTKSSSGMAVVPVCLPLCCGLPCVIL